MRAAESGGGAGGVAGLFTPPTGSPGAVRAAAQQLRSSTEGLAEVASATRSAGRELSGHAWGGDAGSRFAGFAGRLDTAASRSSAPVTALAAAGEHYAAALQTAQTAIRAAKERYDAATAASDGIRHQTNNDPDRTPAQVAAAQKQVDAADARALAAQDDANTAWAAYESACQQVIGEADGARSDAEADGEAESGLRTLIEGSEPYREYNDRFHVAWDGLGLGSWISHAARALNEGGTDAAEALRSLTAERAEWSGLVNSVKILQEQGEVLPSLLEDAGQAASDLARTEGLLGMLGSGRGAAQVLSALEGVGRVVDGAGILGDALTIIDPPDSGTMGNVDRGVAGVNGALLAANLALDEIPVAGEVVMVGTGLYLAGDYLYHHWDAFHDAADAVGHETAQLATGAVHLASDAVGGLKDAGSSVLHHFGL